MTKTTSYEVRASMTDAGPTFKVSAHRWHWTARVAAWWLRFAAPGVHAWVERRTVITFVENYERV